MDTALSAAGAPAQPDSFPALRRLLEAVEDRAAAALDRYQYLVLLLFSCGYFLTTCYCASRKLFWFDELFTVYLSRLPSLSSLWSALTQGADLNPPLLYVFTRASQSLFGEGHLAARLPEIVAFWVFCLCLFRFVSLRTSALGGIISMLFPLVTTAYYYAYEARPHGIVLGFCGLALVCWQAAADRPEHRLGWLLGLGGSLACALLTHSYAFVLFIPLGFGELARNVRSRRFDWAVWLTLAASSSAVLASVSLLYQVKAHVPPGFFPASLGALAKSYLFQLPALAVLSGTIALFCAAQIIGTPRRESKSTATLQWHETVVLLGFVAVPAFVFLAARMARTPMITRYSISSVAGFACLFGIAAARKRAIGIGVLIILLAYIGASFALFVQGSFITEPSSSSLVGTRAPAFVKAYEMMGKAADKNLPIVLLDELDFLPLSYYAPANLASRFVYVPSPGELIGEGYIKLHNCCKTACSVSRRPEFLAAHPTFMAYGPATKLADFIRLGGDIRIQEIYGGLLLAYVTFGPKSQRPAAFPPQPGGAARN